MTRLFAILFSVLVLWTLMFLTAEFTSHILGMKTFVFLHNLPEDRRHSNTDTFQSMLEHIMW